MIQEEIQEVRLISLLSKLVQSIVPVFSNDKWTAVSMFH